MLKILPPVLLLAATAANANIVERRIWIETAIDTIKEDQCQDKMKVWRCIFPERRKRTYLAARA
jgi:hypothetical protein